MKLLKSEKFKIPDVYFITDRKEIKEIPIGVPFIFGDPKSEKYLIRILEYEVLYQEALKSGYPFNFRKILRDAGYESIEEFGYHHPLYVDFMTTEMSEEEFDEEEMFTGTHTLQKDAKKLKDYIKDSSVYVDIQKLKSLNVFPLWLDKIEEAVNTNIHNFAVFNNNMYNKKLEGMYGGLELTSPGKNLIIIDISSSIPKGVSSTCLALSKNLAESFYADILITGSISVLYQYEQIHELNVNTIYEMGMSNDQVYFKKLLSGTERHYKTAIVFGDNDHPGNNWQGGKSISDEDGKKLCKWKVDKLISFHTKGTVDLAGYSRWFIPDETEKIGDWVKYLNE